MLRKKRLEVARFRQGLPLVARTRQDSQKGLLVHQDSHHLLLLNAKDPRQYTYLRNLKKKTLVTVLIDVLL
jgi:hypothetical protein